jgi:hypothetical protein
VFAAAADRLTGRSMTPSLSPKIASGAAEMAGPVPTPTLGSAANLGKSRRTDVAAAFFAEDVAIPRPPETPDPGAVKTAATTTNTPTQSRRRPSLLGIFVGFLEPKRGISTPNARLAVPTSFGVNTPHRPRVGAGRDCPPKVGAGQINPSTRTPDCRATPRVKASGRALDFPQRRSGGRVSERETEHLRVLIANERKEGLALVAPIVS